MKETKKHKKLNETQSQKANKMKIETKIKELQKNVSLEKKPYSKSTLKTLNKISSLKRELLKIA